VLAKEWTHEDELKVAWEDGWEKAQVEDERRFSSLISQSASLDDLKRMFEASLSKK
jgi:hypothetical protein